MITTISDLPKNMKFGVGVKGPTKDHIAINTIDKPGAMKVEIILRKKFTGEEEVDTQYLHNIKNVERIQFIVDEY